MILERIHRILNNKYFVSFIVICIVIAFILFHLLDKQLKGEITALIQYPFILIPLVLIIVAISNFNVCLAIFMLISLLAVIIPKSSIYSNSKESKSSTEGFESKYENDQREKEENTKYYVDGIKNIITGKLKRIDEHHNNEMKKGILENKQKILEHEEKKNNSENTSDSNSAKTITKRVFNPNKEEDTNLMITKEILLDMINRIEYNYENTTYLKKYIKARIEEIIDTNDLLDEDI